MRRSEAGLGLIELMVSLVLGMLVVLGLTEVFKCSRYLQHPAIIGATTGRCALRAQQDRSGNSDGRHVRLSAQ